MDTHDELTDTGVIRIQRADQQAREQFIGHFLRTTAATPTAVGSGLPAPEMAR